MHLIFVYQRVWQPEEKKQKKEEEEEDKNNQIYVIRTAIEMDQTKEVAISKILVLEMGQWSWRDSKRVL